jgi:hypothetical protein
LGVQIKQGAPTTKMKPGSRQQFEALKDQIGTGRRRQRHCDVRVRPALATWAHCPARRDRPARLM